MKSVKAALCSSARGNNLPNFFWLHASHILRLQEKAYHNYNFDYPLTLIYGYISKRSRSECAGMLYEDFKEASHIHKHMLKTP